MNVASLELCKELHELSGWEDEDSLEWHYGNNNELWHRDEEMTGFLCPAYDLGYLLRKLPFFTDIAIFPASRGESYAKAELEQHNLYITADTPENAATKLTIELFKQNILTKET